MSSRRDFLKQGSAVAGAIALGGTLKTAGAGVPGFEQRAATAPMDAAIKELLMESLNAAKSGGATSLEQTREPRRERKKRSCRLKNRLT